MFTPEFVESESGDYVLVANHAIENAKALELSISFNKARIAYAKSQLPKYIDKCTLVYDIRGQRVSQGTVERLKAEFSALATLKVMT